MSLADSLERAASALPDDADDIRPANGDPVQLLTLLGPEAQSRVLTWLLTNDPAVGAELAVAWAEEENGAKPLLELDASALPKKGRKGLRRALHRLRSRGIEVDKGAGREPVVSRLPAIEDNLEMGFVSSLDPRGGRLAYLVEPNPTGGARLFEILIDDVRGIVDFEIYAAGRSKVREFVKRLRSRPGLTVVEAGAPAVRALVARADARHPSDRPSPKGFVEWRSHLTRDVAHKAPGSELAESLADDAEQSALPRAVEMVRGGELGPWPPHDSRLRELDQLVREQTDSTIIVSGARSAERLEQALALAAANLFEGEYAEASAIRFEESAYVFSKCDRVEDARACLAAARAFRETPAGENPVAGALLEICLGSLLESLRGNEDNEDKDEGVDEGGDEPLIVTP